MPKYNVLRSFIKHKVPAGCWIC